MRKAEKKREDLKKWFWVPGYGLYLAIDTLVNEFNNDIESLTRRVTEECRRKENLERLYSEISREVDERRQRIEMIRSRMQELSTQMEQQTAAITTYKKQLVYWEDFHMQVSRLESRLKTGESSPDMLYEVLELMEAFEDAAEE